MPLFSTFSYIFEVHLTDEFNDYPLRLNAQSTAITGYTGITIFCEKDNVQRNDHPITSILSHIIMDRMASRGFRTTTFIWKPRSFSFSIQRTEEDIVPPLPKSFVDFFIFICIFKIGVFDKII